jgi:hypothetical protein
MKNIYEVKNVEPDQLHKLYGIVDDLGLRHEYSGDDGELNVCFGDSWVTFSVDPDILADIRNDQLAYDDAQRVADMYWRE